MSSVDTYANTSVNTQSNAQRDVNNYQFQISSLDGMNIMTSEKQNSERSERLAFLEKALRLRLNENTSYNHQHKRPCELGTRRGILHEINSWVEDVSEESQCFYWLSGEPGVGKSAITASLAQYCTNRTILGAQFFINRDDTTTTDPRVLFPSICWQLCNRFPLVAVTMEKTLRDRPTLVDDISDDQATRLFINAMEAAVTNSRFKPVAIIIDALDETDLKYLRVLSQILSKVAVDLPPNAKVFISSRGEHAITKAFNPLRSRRQVKSRFLAAKQSIKEVSEFMEKKIKEILDDYDMNWADWGDARMKKLSSRASGLYIWAETVLKFVRDEIENKGKASFGGLLDMLTAKGMNDINKLYLGILRRTCKPGDWEYERFRRIIGAILVRQMPHSIADMAQLLNLEERGTSEPVDLVHFVRQYRTVLVNDTKEIDDLVVPRMHKSFADFVTSEWAQEFCIDKSASHKELASRCIKQLYDLTVYFAPDSPDDRQQSRSFPTQLVYSSQHWQTHLKRMVEPDLNNDTEEKNESDALDIPKGNDTECHNVRDLKPDTAKIKRNDVLAFSPDGTQLALSGNSDDIEIRDTKTGSVTVSLVGHEDRVWSVSFSPDGTQLVSASEDQTARIWDVQTGRVLHVLHGHLYTVLCVTFSHDGRKVATGSIDGTVRVWDSSTGQQLNIFKVYSAGWVLYCTFLQNDQCVLSHSGTDGLIMVWDVNSGNLISPAWFLDSRPVLISCGNHLVSRDWEVEEIKLWDPLLGNELHPANSTNAQQESGSQYIDVPPYSVSGCKTPYICHLTTEYGDAYGIVENGQGSTWLSIMHKNDHLCRIYFEVGTTRIR